ncbi:Heparanase-like protein 3 [Striga hermonthica]|uniref:Heparanase-like protein 3 n=1 Tax=Striga hermonthica TaxID=68872 RepID=A0A9N7N550_STRHE|nr:Heparanase-like protein 3 [Striga hermonthica]
MVSLNEWRVFSSVVLIVICLSFACGAESISVTDHGTVYIDAIKRIAKTDSHFICVNIDMWPPAKCDYGVCSWGNASLLTVDLNNPILINAVKAFLRVRLRLGGTLQDRLTYQTSRTSPCSVFTYNPSYLFNYTDGCLSLDRWDQINSFVKRTGAIPIFGLNALAGKIVHPHPEPLTPLDPTTATGPWDPTNSEELIRYTHEEKDYYMYGWELGNELGGIPVEGVRVEPEQYAADAANLEKLLKRIYVTKRAIDAPAVIAPGGVFEYDWFKKFITNESRPSGIITHHTYPLGSGDWYDTNLKNKILNASVLDEGAEVFRQMRELIQQSPTVTFAWIGESGGVYNSGRDGITNTFLFSFWYLDHMATAAVYDTKVYCRQTLVGGNYALLDTTTFIPNPDYYSALLWHRLMGTRVLMTSYKGTKDLRAYAHCAKQSDGITVLLINLSGDTIVKTKVGLRKLMEPLPPNHEQAYREEYHLSPMDGNLQSRTVLLNGKPLFVGPSGAIPTLKPKQVVYSEPITVDPHTIAFVHIPHFLIPACQSLYVDHDDM